MATISIDMLEQFLIRAKQASCAETCAFVPLACREGTRL
jgi:hypothetical protein